MHSSTVTHQAGTATSATFTLHEHTNALHQARPDVVVHKRSAELGVIAATKSEKQPLVINIRGH